MNTRIVSITDLSLITGGGGGADKVLPLQKKGGGGDFSHAQVVAQQVLGEVAVARSFSHSEGGGGVQKSFHPLEGGGGICLVMLTIIQKKSQHIFFCVKFPDSSYIFISLSFRMTIIMILEGG